MTTKRMTVRLDTVVLKELEEDVRTHYTEYLEGGYKLHRIVDGEGRPHWGADLAVVGESALAGDSDVEFWIVSRIDIANDRVDPTTFQVPKSLYMITSGHSDWNGSDMIETLTACKIDGAKVGDVIAGIRRVWASLATALLVVALTACNTSSEVHVWAGAPSSEDLAAFAELGVTPGDITIVSIATGLATDEAVPMVLDSAGQVTASVAEGVSAGVVGGLLPELP